MAADKRVVKYALEMNVSDFISAARKGAKAFDKSFSDMGDSIKQSQKAITSMRDSLTSYSSARTQLALLKDTINGLKTQQSALNEVKKRTGTLNAEQTAQLASINQALQLNEKRQAAQKNIVQKSVTEFARLSNEHKEYGVSLKDASGSIDRLNRKQKELNDKQGQTYAAAEKLRSGLHRLGAIAGENGAARDIEALKFAYQNLNRTNDATIAANKRLANQQEQMRAAMRATGRRYEDLSASAREYHDRLQQQTRGYGRTIAEALRYRRELIRLSSVGRTVSNVAAFTQKYWFVLQSAMASVTRVVQGITKAFEKLDELDKLTAEIGASADFLQNMQYWAARSGVSIDDLDRGISKFTKRLGEARRGSTALGQTMLEMGINVKDSSITTEKALLAYADAVANVSNKQEMAALTSQGFGVRNTRMVNMLAQGSKGYQQMAADVTELGIKLDEVLIRKGAEAADEWGKKTESIANNWTRLKMVFEPAAQSMGAFARGSVGFAADIGRGFGTVGSEVTLSMRLIKQAYKDGELSSADFAKAMLDNATSLVSFGDIAANVTGDLVSGSEGASREMIAAQKDMMNGLESVVEQYSQTGDEQTTWLEDQKAALLGFIETAAKAGETDSLRFKHAKEGAEFYALAIQEVEKKQREAKESAESLDGQVEGLVRAFRSATSEGKSVQDALKSMFGKIELTGPTLEVDKLVESIKKIESEGKASSVAVRTALQGAFKNLGQDELAGVVENLNANLRETETAGGDVKSVTLALRTALRTTMEKSGVDVDSLTGRIFNITGAAAAVVAGVDEISASTRGALIAFDNVAKNAEANALAIKTQFETALSEIGSEAGLEELRRRIEDLGSVGKLSGDEVEDMLDRIRIKALEADEDLGPLGRSLEYLGIKSGEASKAGDRFVAEWERVEELVKTLGPNVARLGDETRIMSGEVETSLGKVRAAFLEKMGTVLDSADAETLAFVKQQAAALGLTDALDDFLASKAEQSREMKEAADAAKEETEALSENLELAEGEAELQQKRNELKIAEARARGDSAEATKLEIENLKISIEVNKAKIAAAETELLIEQELQKARIAKMQAEGASQKEIDDTTEAQERQNEAMRQKIELMKLQNQGLKDNVETMEQNKKQTQETSESTEGLGRNTGNLVRTLSTVEDRFGDINKELKEHKSRSHASANSQAFLAGELEKSGVAMEHMQSATEAANEAYSEQIAKIDKWKEGLRNSASASSGGDTTALAWADKYVDMLQEAEKAAQRAGERAADLARVQDNLNETVSDAESAYDAGDISLNQYIRSLESATGLATRLGDEQLADLRSAIEDAKEEMQDFTDEAAEGLQELQAEWMELNGDDLGALQIEQQQERLELEEKLNDAREQGNFDAERSYREQLDLLDKIQAKEVEDLTAEQAEKTADALNDQADAASDAEDALDSLGDTGEQAMSDVEQATSQAQSEMDSFTDSARQGLDALKIELAGLNDDQAKALELEQKQELLEIEKNIAEAKASGNDDAVKAFEQQRSLLKQIHGKEKDVLKEQENQAREAERQAEAEEKAAEQAERAEAAAEAKAASDERLAEMKAKSAPGDDADTESATFTDDEDSAGVVRLESPEIIVGEPAAAPSPKEIRLVFDLPGGVASGRFTESEAEKLVRNFERAQMTRTGARY